MIIYTTSIHFPASRLISFYIILRFQTRCRALLARSTSGLPSHPSEKNSRKLNLKPKRVKPHPNLWSKMHGSPVPALLRSLRSLVLLACPRLLFCALLPAGFVHNHHHHQNCIYLLQISNAQRKKLGERKVIGKLID